MRPSIGMCGLLLFQAVMLSLFLLRVLLLIHRYLLQYHPERQLLQKILISLPGKKKIDLLLLMLTKGGEWWSCLELSRLFLCFMFHLKTLCIWYSFMDMYVVFLYFYYGMCFILDYGMDMCFIMIYDIYDIIFIGEICISSCCRFWFPYLFSLCGCGMPIFIMCTPLSVPSIYHVFWRMAELEVGGNHLCILFVFLCSCMHKWDVECLRCNIIYICFRYICYMYVFRGSFAWSLLPIYL